VIYNDNKHTANNAQRIALIIELKAVKFTGTDIR